MSEGFSIYSFLYLHLARVPVSNFRLNMDEITLFGKTMILAFSAIQIEKVFFENFDKIGRKNF